jgi:hypothetical protein
VPFVIAPTGTTPTANKASRTHATTIDFRMRASSEVGAARR